ncbi:MAG: exosortase U, partial [Planctomycetota bacterium]|nr:exosortase U [Planctomycetota bacterium]
KFMYRSRFSKQMSLRLVMGVLLILFGPFSAISYGRVISRWVSAPASTHAAAPTIPGNMSLTLAEAGKMPESLDHWVLVNTEQVSRDPDDPMGSNSAVFTYRGHGLEVSFSVDGYYAEWHDLAYCYTSLDWKLKDQANSQDEVTKSYRTRLALYEEDGRQMLTFFSCFDSKMVPVRPGQRTIGTIKTFENLLERIGWEQNPVVDTPVSPPVFQFQLLCVTSKELLDHEQENLSQLFDKLSQQALAVLRESSK